ISTGTNPGGHNCPVHITADDLVCGLPTTLTAVPSGTGPFQYAWNTGDTTATIPFGETFFDYAVTVTDANGCVGITSQHFGNAHPFFIHVESAGNPCVDGTDPSLTATTFGAVEPLTYLWSTGDTTQTITGINQEQVYEVTITDANGCSSTGTGFYHPGGFIQALNITGPTTTACDNEPITLEIIDPDPNFTYTWIVGMDTLTGPSISTTTPGYYSIFGVSNDNPACQRFGTYQVQNGNLTSKDVVIVNINHPCDDIGCFLVVSDDGSFAFLDSSVVWSDATAIDLFGVPAILCTTEAGEYQADVNTGCNSFSLPFSFDPNAECVDICGTIIMDMDQDCIPDEATHNWSQNVVLLTNDNTNISYPVHPAPDGSFCATLPEGTYSISTRGVSLSSDCAQLRPTMEVTLASSQAMEIFASPPREVDNDAEVTSLNGVSITEFALKVYPNPSNGSFQFDFAGQSVSNTDQLIIFDALGRMAAQTSVAALPRPWQPVAVNTPGIYQ
ncbi:MAG: hypothetical protein AAF597_14895, partial [Bacteroidota bacterium]